ncbi:PEP-CTERM sorting domain-containing protein [Colwellia sp. M166]|uniref:PEP-CTERM sorting domain-containing protein n=1 Tax=Colwellia sp. M166 TaxID=2583805 RepID=UPI00211EA72A|nr:PEP-CTERM sorting domain-containing protein [Colwellia sp. M166]
MSIITNSLKMLTFGALLATTSAYATDIALDGTTVSVNDRADAGQGGWIYNVDQMDVSWGDDDTITVDVFTKFASSYRGRNSNNTYSDGSNHKNIIFGDLLIGANSASNSGFNYAFSLGDLYSGWNTRFSRIERLDQTNGGLYKINGTTSAGSYHGYSDDRGAVFGQTKGHELNENASTWSSTNEKISFSFNVSGLDAFREATSLSLSWAMSCYNDAVHETFAVNRGNSPVVDVPEPATIILMLLALAGIAYRQRAKSNLLSA